MHYYRSLLRDFNCSFTSIDQLSFLLAPMVVAPGVSGENGQRDRSSEKVKSTCSKENLFNLKTYKKPTSRGHQTVRHPRQSKEISENIPGNYRVLSSLILIFPAG